MFTSNCCQVASAFVLVVMSLTTPSVVRAQCDLDETQKVIAPTPASEAHFGFAVAMDGATAVVGSTAESVAYVFRFDSAQWNQQGTLLVTGLTPFDRFGSAVAISSDRVIVGASSEDSEVNNTGAAYVFRREQTEWIQETRLTASDPEEDDIFGSSVALNGDRAIVGAPDVKFTPGKAYIFRWDGAKQSRDRQGAIPAPPGDFRSSAPSPINCIKPLFSLRAAMPGE